MRTLFLLVLITLFIGEETESKKTLFNSQLLENGKSNISYPELIMRDNKSKMFIFYSSQHCGPCLEQLALVKNSLGDLNMKYQLIFVDSWTLGAAKKHQSEKYALDFYNSYLRTDNTLFVLDPNDALLYDFQKMEPHKYSLPFVAITDSKGSVKETSSMIVDFIDFKS